MEKLLTLWEGSGLYNLTFGQAVMILVGLVLLYLAIAKKFEPLLLVPIGFGGILANIPEAGLAISALDQAIEVARPAVLQQMAAALGATLDPLAGEEAWRATLKALVDNGAAPDQIRAARDMGVRFHPTRGSMDRGSSDGGLPPDFGRHSVGAENHPRALRNLAQFIDKDGPGAPQFIHDIAVVNDLFANKNWSAVEFESDLDNINRAYNPGTETSRF